MTGLGSSEDPLSVRSRVVPTDRLVRGKVQISVSYITEYMLRFEQGDRHDAYPEPATEKQLRRGAGFSMRLCHAAPMGSSGSKRNPNRMSLADHRLARAPAVSQNSSCTRIRERFYVYLEWHLRWVAICPRRLDMRRSSPSAVQISEVSLGPVTSQASKTAALFPPQSRHRSRVSNCGPTTSLRHRPPSSRATSSSSGAIHQRPNRPA